MHSTTTRSNVVNVVHEVDRRRMLLIAPIQCATANEFLLFRSTDWVRVRQDTTRSASTAVAEAGEPIN